VSVYKPCDIRGNAGEELSPALYESWGRTLGRQLAPGSTVVIGGDVRGSTPPYLAALGKGLVQAGMEVTNLGLLPTPMIYFAKRHLQASACAIVTASHNPATINGLKWMLGDRPPTPEGVAVLERGVTETIGARDTRTQGTMRDVDMVPDYVRWLQEEFKTASAAPLKVVLDPMYGCWSERARRYLQGVFPRCEFSAIRDAADPQFGGCTPDCSRPEKLSELRAAVCREKAHLGIAFDGDGDRVGFVDNEGVALKAEEATWVLLHGFGSEIRGSRFVYDLKFSDRIPEAARQLGAEPLVERSGHAFIRTRMCEADGLFGAEISGHYFYRALNGGDDGLHTACRAIAHLAESGRTMSQLRCECPAVYISPDLRVAVTPEMQEAIVARIRGQWAEYPQQTIDGIRIDTPEGWALVRNSVTEAALTFRFEGRDRPGLENLVRQFLSTLPEFRDALWSQFEASLAAQPSDANH
jgi:phosphomannomutase